jgi:hypothetical protein
MKKCLYKTAFLCVFNTLFICHSFGQTAQPDTVYLQNTINKTVSDFYVSIGEQSRLYNGSEYHSYDRTIKGNALYPPEAQGLNQGDVDYDGVVYKNVPLMYDIYRDQVVTVLYNHFSLFSLAGDRVYYFDILGRHFIRLSADSIRSDDESDISDGFYEQLYGGKTQVLAKRSKTIQNSTNQIATLETFFVATDDYYVRKNNHYYKIKKEGSLLKVLKDKKPALQKYIDDNNIRFGSNPQVAMARIAAYYDSLTTN